MYLNAEKIKELCLKNGISLKNLLAKAGVSKTAYYNLLYRESLLPNSLHAIASTLEVQPSALLKETDSDEMKIIQIARQTDKIIEKNPHLDRDNVRHTLILLEEEPIQRLRRGLLRAGKRNKNGNYK